MDSIFCDEFLTSYFGQNYIHIPEMVTDPDDLFNHDDLTDLLNNRRLWSPRTLLVMDDTVRVSEKEFFDPSPAPGGAPRLNIDKLTTLIRRGCSLVLNDVIDAHPKLRRFGQKLKTFTDGRVQANLYFSMGGKKAFGPHFDNHEVFAFHTAGEKVWNIYENRESNPVSNDIFNVSVSDRRKLCGELQEAVTLKPGSLLYLPRGKFHDALASGNGAIHIAFGVTRMKPVDLFEPIWAKMLMEEWIRGDLSPEMTEKDIGNLFDKLADVMKSYSSDKKLMAEFKAKLEAWPLFENEIDVAPLLTEEKRYEVSKAVKVALKNNKPHLTDGQKFAELPAHQAKIVTFILSHDEITAEDVMNKFGQSRQEVDGLLVNLKNKGVLR